MGAGYAFGKGLYAPGWRVRAVGILGSYDYRGTLFGGSLARVGRRFGPRLSLGLEGGALGNEEYAAGRGGGFVRADLRAVEVTLSGGFTGNYLEDEPSGYVSLALAVKC